MVTANFGNRISPLMRGIGRNYDDFPPLVKRNVGIPEDATPEVKSAAERISLGWDYVVKSFKEDGGVAPNVAYVFHMEDYLSSESLTPSVAVARLNFYDYKKKLKGMPGLKDESFKDLDAAGKSKLLKLLDNLDRNYPVSGEYCPVTLLYSGRWDKKKLDRAADFKARVLEFNGIRYHFDIGELDELVAEPPESSGRLQEVLA